MGFWAWLDSRTGVRALAPLVTKKEVPVHRHTLWYYLGGMTLFLFAIQVGTGVLLLFYYRPSAEEAHESVQFVMAEVQFGWLIRSIHSWAANLMIFTLFLHLFSVLLVKAYKPPRDLTWYSGFLLFAVALGFGFTGYLLPWNELAYFATRVGTQITGVIPVVGGFLLRLLRGGEDVTGATLTRFYAIHVALLPATAVLLLGLHLFLVQKHGMSIPTTVARETPTPRMMRFFPNFFLRDLVGWLAALAILAALAAFFPTELGNKADPFAPAPAGIRPEWYFMFMFQTLKLLPGHILGIEGEVLGVVGFAVAGALLFLFPLLEQRFGQERHARLFTAAAVVVIVYMVVLTVVGYLVNPKA